jgi:hypothetical protein
MTYAVGLISVLALLAIVRIILLNSEIDSLAVASAKYLTLVRANSNTPDAQETLVEYLWLKNATDEKKESRTIWFGGTLILLTCLVIAVVSKSS